MELKTETSETASASYGPFVINGYHKRLYRTESHSKTRTISAGFIICSLVCHFFLFLPVILRLVIIGIGLTIPQIFIISIETACIFKWVKLFW